jgi:hypothetical protein
MLPLLMTVACGNKQPVVNVAPSDPVVIAPSVTYSCVLLNIKIKVPGEQKPRAHSRLFTREEFAQFAAALEAGEAYDGLPAGTVDDIALLDVECAP